jgi:type VI secretion system protein ImpH
MRDLDVGLDQELKREGYRFRFFQAVRLLERLYPDRKRVGHHENPRDEVVRFRTRQSLAFPASEIYELEAPDDSATDARDTMWVNFMSLTALQGALPRHYSSLLADPAVRAETAALREFLDLFNHRFISLFYRAWEKYRFAIAYERGGTDMFSEYLYCLIGLGTPGLRGRMHIDDQILLYYAGLIAQRPRSAVALEGILEDYFGIPVHVVQFQGEWFQMNPDLLSSLGADGQNNQLGVSAVLWERIWDPQSRFRVNVGPLSYTQFCDFLPGSDAHIHIVELTRFFVGEDVNFEVSPILRREEIPYCVLGRDPSVRLGWSMWMKVREFEEDVSQPVFGARLAAS